MTRGVLKAPPAPGKASAGWSQPLRVALAVVALALLVSGRALAKKGDGLPEGTIAEIKIEGNVTIATEKVRAKLLSRPGNPLDAKTIDADHRTLLAQKWFSEVQPYYEEVPPKSGKYVLTFTVKEMPVLSHVEFRGRKNTRMAFNYVTLKEIEETTGLKVGNRADSRRAQLAIGQIQRLYAEKGYEFCEVRLLEGGKPGETRVVMEVFEGPRQTVGDVNFEGNEFVSGGVLKTKISLRRPIAGVFGGTYHRDALEESARKLREYYQGQGFYEVKVTPITRPGANLGDTHVTFVIAEGVRYKVRNITFEGNKKLSGDVLRAGMLMHSGQPILETMKEADRKTLIGKYYEIGCIDTQINPDPRLTDQPGVIDLVYKIEEGEPFLLGNLIIKGNDRTQDRVLRREANFAGLLPGEVLNLNRIDTYKRRLSSTGYFGGGPGGAGGPAAPPGKGIDVKVVNRRPGDKPYGEGMTIDLNSLGVTRMQNAGPEIEAIPVPAPGAGPARSSPVGPGFGSGGIFNPQADTLPAIPVPEAPLGPPPVVVAPPLGGRGSTPIGGDVPPGMQPSVPGMNVNDIGPDRGDAFPNRSYADVITSIEEAPTGRFSLGFGASGSQGLFGNVSIYEKNFNILNFPRSFAEITNGQAFRGGGQEFQVSAFVGTLFNQFSISLRDPYLFDLPIGGGMTGYYRTRIYPDWTEDRGGGRFWLGRQFGTATWADIAFRAEDINFFGYRTPAPADYLAANGHTQLFSLRPSLRFDSRNSPFLPNKGQYLELSFEQGWGTFSFPKAEIEGRTYFLLGSRPDGSGPQTLELRGHFGITGRDTPVYERFFAGYFGSLRGFQYRGVGPHVLGSNVGGIMEALGSVEYMFPLTANDAIRQVVFCDFGTVTPNYSLDNFRVSVGTGLRMAIPALGPLPLAFDLAFPIAKAPGDKISIFIFSVGASY